MPILSPRASLEGLAKDKTDILDGVVIINVDIPFCLNRKIVKPVLGEQGQHVVKERHTRVDLRGSATINRYRQDNIGLSRLARDSRYAFG